MLRSDIQYHTVEYRTVEYHSVEYRTVCCCDLCKNPADWKGVSQAMGAESDQEIIQMIGSDHPYCEMMMPSFEECQVIQRHISW